MAISEARDRRPRITTTTEPAIEGEQRDYHVQTNDHRSARRSRVTRFYGAPMSGFIADAEARDGSDVTTVTYVPPGRPPMEGDIHRPATNRTRTAVIILHGAGAVPVSPERSPNRHRMRFWAEYYAAHGLLAFNVSFTLTTPPGPIFPAPIVDAKNAVQYLRAHAAELGIEPDHIVLQGHSGGARMGGNVLVTPDDPYFTSVGTLPDVSDAINGFIGFYGGYTGAVGRQASLSIFYGGEPNSTDPAVTERYRYARSVDMAAMASGPALLIHGDADAIPVNASRQFANALEATGSKAEVVVFEGAGHGFDRDMSTGNLSVMGAQAGERTLAWIDANFGG